MNLRKVASRQDNRVAKKTGWGVQTNSGATKGKKGDLKYSNLLVETKTVVHKTTTFKLMKSWFEKARDQAFRMGKQFSIIVYSFGGLEDYVAMDLRDFKKIFNIDDAYILRLAKDLITDVKSYCISEDWLRVAVVRADQDDKELGIVVFDFNKSAVIVNMTLEDFDRIYNKTREAY